MPNFVNHVLDFQPKDSDSSNQQSEGADALMDKKVKSGKDLIFELKKLFGSLACGNKKYVDP